MLNVFVTYYTTFEYIEWIDKVRSGNFQKRNIKGVINPSLKTFNFYW